MESDPARVCELLVGFGDVEVLGVDDEAGAPLRVHIRRRAPSAPSKAGWSSKNRLAQLPHTILRRCHTNVMRRPDTSRSRTLLARRSCTRRHLNPHCTQRSRLNVDSSLTTSAPGVSSTTSNTRTCAKCSRTVITSRAIGALLDR